MKDAGEQAMALVDGQLAPEEVPALVAELARNGPLVAELQTYLALSRSRLEALYAEKSEEPVPARLTETVLRGTPAPASAGETSRFVAGLGRWLKTRYEVPAWSLAAAAPVLAAVALVLHVAMPPLPAPTDGRPTVLAEADLGPALERTASGKDATVATLRPVLSFSSKAGGWCRQVEVRNATRHVSHALACRGGDGQWKVVAATPPSSASGFAPAGAGGRKAIDDLATSMMQGSPLSAEEEAQAIGRQWRTL